MENYHTDQKSKYPKAVFIIFVCEFCERFTCQNMKAILVLYFLNKLKYDIDTSTILYHVFRMLCFFSTLVGGIIADSFLGKYRTIIYLSILFTIGDVILSIGAVPVIPIDHREISFIGLMLLAIGTGGIKPCVSAFGAEQFTLPEQSSQLERYFSAYYLTIEVGSLFASFLSPILRKDVHCFGENSCFSLAFGVPTFLMIISITVFVSGKKLYNIKDPEENVTLIFVKYLWSALKNKIFNKCADTKEHWLENAGDKFSKKQVSDFRNVLNTLFLFIPAPIFWTLIVQMGSRWTLQSTNMDGRFLGYVIKPDQMHLITPVTFLIFIPLLDLYIYPLLKIIGIRRPLQKIILGGFLGSVAYLMAAFLQFYIQDSYGIPLIKGYGQLRLFNSLNCKVMLNPPIQNVSEIAPLSFVEILNIPVTDKVEYETIFEIDNNCPYNLYSYRSNIKVFEKKARSYFISENLEKNLFIYQLSAFDDLLKDTDGYAKIRIFYSSSFETILDVELQNSVDSSTIFSQKFLKSNTGTDLIMIPSGVYNLVTNKSLILKNIVINPAEIDTILLHQSNDLSNIEGKLINLVPPNKVHMLWQLPQFIVLSIAEIIFYITGLKFSFTEAPESMKSVLSAAWILQVAIGDFIVGVITGVKLFTNQGYEFLFYSIIMVLDMIVFIKLCIDYKYVNVHDK